MGKISNFPMNGESSAQVLQESGVGRAVYKEASTERRKSKGKPINNGRVV